MDIHDEITIPGQEVRHGAVPAWLADSPVWLVVKTRLLVASFTCTKPWGWNRWDTATTW